jgi:hypothetical protein
MSTTGALLIAGLVLLVLGDMAAVRVILKRKRRKNASVERDPPRP